jgi:hypothetical protein
MREDLSALLKILPGMYVDIYVYKYIRYICIYIYVCVHIYDMYIYMYIFDMYVYMREDLSTLLKNSSRYIC